jgi:hypothetical protein
LIPWCDIFGEEVVKSLVFLRSAGEGSISFKKKPGKKIFEKICT